jgi:ribonucleoside-triphosphate reductase
VYKRDGRLVPFDADKISQALFAATEGLGRPDAFLVRELTDGVVHFLAAEADGTIPRTAQVADLIVKVVRELGQPALARAFQEGQRAKDERRDQVRRAETAVPQEHASGRRPWRDGPVAPLCANSPCTTCSPAT